MIFFQKKFVFFNKKDHKKVYLIDAILATSAAPSYFPIHTFNVNKKEQLRGSAAKICSHCKDAPNSPFCKYCYFKAGVRSFSCVDGGIWANDPRLAALLFDRVQKSKKDKKSQIYTVISFGTGEEQKSQTDWIDKSSSYATRASWMLGDPDIISIIFDATSSWTGVALDTLSATKIVRTAKIQIYIPKDDFIRLDDASSLEKQEKQINLFNQEKPDKYSLAIRYFCSEPCK